MYLPGSCFGLSVRRFAARARARFGGWSGLGGVLRFPGMGAPEPPATPSRRSALMRRQCGSGGLPPSRASRSGEASPAGARGPGAYRVSGPSRSPSRCGRLAPRRARCPGPRRAAAGLALLAFAALAGLSGTAQAQTETELWSATLTVGTGTAGGATWAGYEVQDSRGEVSPPTFTYRTATIGVTTLQYDSRTPSTLVFDFVRSAGTTPSDGLLGPGTFTLHVGSKTFTIDDPGRVVSFHFTGHGLSWSSGDTVTVRLTKTVADTTRPTIVSNVEFNGIRTGVNSLGNRVDLVFSEDMGFPSQEVLPAAVKNAFSVTADGENVPILSVSRDAGTSKRLLVVTFATGEKIYQGQDVRLAYNRTTAGSDALEDEAGNEMEMFSNFTVTNNSTQIQDTTRRAPSTEPPVTSNAGPAIVL